jgi:hypothetical protein
MKLMFFKLSNSFMLRSPAQRGVSKHPARVWGVHGT